MNYLVTYYKNLAEDLQARINQLKQHINEDGGYPPGGLNDPRRYLPSMEPIRAPEMETPYNGKPYNPAFPKDGTEWTDSDGIRYRIRDGVKEWYWYGKTGEGWLPVDDQQLGNP